jgi:hypothetical protein
VPSKQGRYSETIFTRSPLWRIYLRVISSEVASGVNFLPNFTLRGNNERSYSQERRPHGQKSFPTRSHYQPYTNKSHHHGTPATITNHRGVRCSRSVIISPRTLFQEHHFWGAPHDVPLTLPTVGYLFVLSGATVTARTKSLVYR